MLARARNQLGQLVCRLSACNKCAKKRTWRSAQKERKRASERAWARGSQSETVPGGRKNLESFWGGKAVEGRQGWSKRRLPNKGATADHSQAAAAATATATETKLFPLRQFASGARQASQPAKCCIQLAGLWTLILGTHSREQAQVRSNERRAFKSNNNNNK